ncbi:MAG: hypothetical protein KAU31_08325 [Spirochaetaceae bacterium]|nr:hypothetical protein [Spirochaetaceae bacterium]
MRRSIVFLGVALVVLFVAGCAGGPPTEPAQFEEPSFKIIEYKNSALGAEVPDWVTMDVGELEDDFEGEYIFRFEQTGQNLTGVKNIADNMNAPAEVARLVSTRVQQKFAGAQVGDQDFVETYFENVVRTVSDAEINGLRKYGDFWVLKEYYDEKGNPTEREYEYYTMYRISSDQVDDLIERAISGLDAQTEEEQTARERVREIMNDGI